MFRTTKKRTICQKTRKMAVKEICLFSTNRLYFKGARLVYQYIARLTCLRFTIGKLETELCRPVGAFLHQLHARFPHFTEKRFSLLSPTGMNEGLF